MRRKTSSKGIGALRLGRDDPKPCKLKPSDPACSRNGGNHICDACEKETQNRRPWEPTDER